LEIFKKNRQLKPWAKETGGQLFCHFEEEKVIVEQATKPRYGFKSGRYYFWLNREKEQKEIYGQFEQSLHYIGDWHTHPESYPKPSIEDIRKMQAIYRESTHSLKYMILVVVGKEKLPEGLWVGIVDYEDDIIELEHTVT